jgi:hypothetical protein
MYRDRKKQKGDYHTPATFATPRNENGKCGKYKENQEVTSDNQWKMELE